MLTFQPTITSLLTTIIGTGELLALTAISDGPEDWSVTSTHDGEESKVECVAGVIKVTYAGGEVSGFEDERALARWLCGNAL